MWWVDKAVPFLLPNSRCQGVVSSSSSFKWLSFIHMNRIATFTLKLWCETMDLSLPCRYIWAWFKCGCLTWNAVRTGAHLGLHQSWGMWGLKDLDIKHLCAKFQVQCIIFLISIQWSALIWRETNMGFVTFSGSGSVWRIDWSPACILPCGAFSPAVLLCGLLCAARLQEVVDWMI